LATLCLASLMKADVSLYDRRLRKLANPPEVHTLWHLWFGAY
jgi:hypothetical protein